MSMLEISALNMGREMPFRKPLRYCAWFHSRWFLLSLGGMVSLATLIGLETGAPATYVLGQIALGLSVYLSLFFLADRPLINPIQAVVGVFYWWFGVGPVVIASWNYLLGMSDVALGAQVSGIEALWIVAPGLLLYAIIARLTLQWFSRTGSHAKFLLPARENYRPKVLIIYLSLTCLSMLVLMVLQHLGIHGQEETSFFGGTKTNIWWVGVIVAVGSIAPFVASALMTALATPWKTVPFSFRILIVVIVVQTAVFAMFGGWKSPIALLGAYFACAYVSRRQRPPWLILAVGALVFLVFITPFVTYGRNVALVSEAVDSAMRKQIFSEVVKDPRAFLPTAVKAIDPAILFRGIYPLAGELTRRNGFFEGEWHGDTIAWGLEIPVPRVLFPDKHDANIGNYFAQTVGVDIGVIGADDTLTNISITIPFEFVGNYGLCAGILSFGLIGFFWSLLCGWLLSPARLSNHPLTPFMAIYPVMGMERALGHYLATLRELIIPLLLCYFVYRMLHGKV